MFFGTYLAYAIAMVLLHPGAIYPFAPDTFDDPDYRYEVVGDREVTLAVAEGNEPLAVLFFMGNGGRLDSFP